MRRKSDLLKKREKFIIDYIKDNKSKQMKIIVNELIEILFISERTIYLVYANYHNNKKYGKMLMKLIKDKFTGPIDEDDNKVSECGNYGLEVTWHTHRQLQYYEVTYKGNYILWFYYSNETHTFDEEPNIPKDSKSLRSLYNEISKLTFK